MKNLTFSIPANRKFFIALIITVFLFESSVAQEVNTAPINSNASPEVVKLLDTEAYGVIVAKTFSLKHALPSELATILVKLMSRYGKITPDDAARTITVKEFPSVIDDLMEKCIEGLDVEW